MLWMVFIAFNFDKFIIDSIYGCHNSIIRGTIPPRTDGPNFFNTFGIIHSAIPLSNLGFIFLMFLIFIYHNPFAFNSLSMDSFLSPMRSYHLYTMSDIINIKMAGIKPAWTRIPHIAKGV